MAAHLIGREPMLTFTGLKSTNATTNAHSRATTTDAKSMSTTTSLEPALGMRTLETKPGSA
jgi:hypothetical protein